MKPFETRRIGLVFLVLMLVVPTLAACGGGRGGDVIHIGVRTANDHVPFYIADQQGAYAKRGHDVTVRLVPSNTEIVEGLQRNEFQVGAFPATTAIAAIAQGAPFHIVAMTGRGSDGLLVRQDGPQTVAELRGKRVATIRASILDVLLRVSLEDAGLDADRDLELVYTNNLGDMISALKTGQVDACSNTEPFMTDAERQGWGRVLTYYTEAWPDHPCCVVVARDDLVDKRPDVVIDILAAHCDAIAVANADRRATAEVIVKTLDAFDVELVEASLDPTRMTIDYHVTPEEMAHMAQVMVDQGLIEEAPSPERLVNPVPLARALGQMP